MKILRRIFSLLLSFVSRLFGRKKKEQAGPGQNLRKLVPVINPAVEKTLAVALTQTGSIPVGRKAELGKLASYINDRFASGRPANILFICTHNSRRSLMAQAWASVVSHRKGWSQRLIAWSGGTEVTAFNPKAVDAMERAGFTVARPEGQNPRIQLGYSGDIPPMTGFSKSFDDPYNPRDSFAAVMVCSDADKGCPTVAGSDIRISLPYTDPGKSDGTPGESEAYDACSLQIASEMLYLLELVK